MAANEPQPLNANMVAGKPKIGQAMIELRKSISDRVRD